MAVEENYQAQVYASCTSGKQNRISDQMKAFKNFSGIFDSLVQNLLSEQRETEITAKRTVQGEASLQLALKNRRVEIQRCRRSQIGESTKRSKWK